MYHVSKTSGGSAHKRSRGVNILEFVIVLPIIISFLVFLFETIYDFYKYAELSLLTNEATRKLSISYHLCATPFEQYETERIVVNPESLVEEKIRNKLTDYRNKYGAVSTWKITKSDLFNANGDSKNPFILQGQMTLPRKCFFCSSVRENRILKYSSELPVLNSHC